MKISSGNKIGRKQDFPTLNIYEDLPSKYTSGVYFVQLILNKKKKKGLLFYKKNFKRIEIHLIDFNKNVYDDDIQILKLKKHRNFIERYKHLKEKQQTLENDINQLRQFKF